MYDGIKINIQLLDFHKWRRSINVGFHLPMFIENADIKEKVRNINGVIQKVITYKGNFETYRLTVKEVTETVNNKSKTTYNLILEGSLHKNYFGGANYKPFNIEALKTELEHIEKELKIPLDKAVIHNLEFGVNIPFPYPVFPFFKKNLISYKGKSFNRYNTDRKGVCLGDYCDFSQYRVKIYDKGKQHKLPNNLMRFELSFKKMQKIKGICTLSDLPDLIKIQGLRELLLDAWNNVLLNDSSIDLNNLELKQGQKEVLKNGGNPKYWELLKETDTRKFNYERDQFKKLVALYGKNEHKRILDLINSEWQNLSGICTNLPSGKTQNLYKFTVKVKGKIVQKDLHYPLVLNTELLNGIEKRVCLSCGNDISNQKGNSQFCSAKYVGEKKAHQCRNMNSNNRNNLKRKISTITKKGVLFDISPYVIQHHKTGVSF
jgi:hypothetical protein